MTGPTALTIEEYFEQTLVPASFRLQFEVRGLPIAQGTARAFVAGGRARIATDANNPKTPLGSWRASISRAADDALGQDPPWRGPVSVWVVFTFPRPAAHYLPANLSRPEPVLREGAPSWVAGKPDIDKLLRALLDGLTNVAIADDKQVVEAQAWKRYGEVPGCNVTVTSL